jgi:sugar phosphate isomerase/epimerase
MKQTNELSRRAFLQCATASLAGGLTLGSVTRATPGLATTAGSWQIGCYTRVFDRWDYRVALDGIAEAGYRYAGVLTTKPTPDQDWILVSATTPLAKAEEIGQEVRKRGLSVPSLYGVGFEKSRSRDDGIEALKRLIDNAQACGAKNLLLGGTNAQGAAYDLYYQIVAGACDYAQALGIGLSVKPHGGTNATGPQCRRAIEKVGHVNFRVWYDPGNTFYYSEGKLDPVDDAPTVSDLVVGMCVKDYLPPKNVYVTPGRGRVDFPAVLARLMAGGFQRGPLIVECVNRDGDLKQTIEEARQARLYLERIVAG